MTDILTIRYTVQRLEDNTIYVEYYPTNLGTEGVVFHGQTLEVVGSIKQTVEAYEPRAREEILNVLNSIYGGYV